MSYTTSQAHLLDELDRIRSLLEHVSQADDPPTDQSRRQRQGPVTPADLPLAVSPDVRDSLADERAEIDRRCRETPSDVTLRLRVLADQFDLSRNHLDVLLLAAAPDIDPSIQSLFVSLTDRPDATHPTVGLVERLFGTSRAEQLAAFGLVGLDSPLRTHGLLDVDTDAETADAHTLRISDRLRDYLKRSGGLDPTLGSVAAVVDPQTQLADLRLSDHVHGEVAALHDQRTDADRGSTVYHFHGSEGSEKRRAVEALVDGDLLRGDLDAILDADRLDRFCREARLQDCPVLLTNVSEATRDRGPTPGDDPRPAADRPTLGDVLDSLSGLGRDLFLTGTESWRPTSSRRDATFELLEFPEPGVHLRYDVWGAYADEFAPDVDRATLASTFQLTQGQIDDAVTTARALSSHAGVGTGRQNADSRGGHTHVEGGLSREVVVEACTTQSADGLDDLAEKIEPDANWQEIVLKSDTERELREVSARIRYRGTVSETWGFDQRFSRGTGVVTLFAGSSGTGKTLAAEVIANDVGMDLYKIDLSSVVSKYIGETEENLERIFDAAADSNAILLFDEADAVFGERAGVSDATDRYANVEVNYLLQRIESYDGVVMLTTNNKSQMDSAFTRRIHQTVDFSRPRQAEREQIWRVTAPELTPPERLDDEFLAGFEITGGNIRNAAQTAAVLAADDDGVVRMRHVVEALQQELDKLGVLYGLSDFGEYSEFLHTGPESSGGETTSNGGAR